MRKHLKTAITVAAATLLLALAGGADRAPAQDHETVVATKVALGVAIVTGNLVGHVEGASNARV